MPASKRRAASGALGGAFDSFIDTNIEQITRDTGRTDLAALRLQLEQANLERARISSMESLVSNSLQRRDWVAISAELKTEAIAELEAQRQRLETTLAGVADGSTQAIDLKAELAKLETDMQNAAVAELTTLRQQVASAQARSTDLRGQLRSGVLESDLPAALLTNIYELQQNAELARTQYQTLLSRTKDLEVQASLQVPDSRVVSAARAPTEPSFPNPRLILGIAGIVALGLGIGLAFLAENFVGGFSSEEQMQSVLRATSVVAVPRQRPSKGPIGGGVGVADLVVQSPLSAFSEALRRIRIGVDNILKRRSATEGGTAIMVTSAAPNEGKTTLACAGAHLCARALDAADRLRHAQAQHPPAPGARTVVGPARLSPTSGARRCARS